MSEAANSSNIGSTHAGGPALVHTSNMDGKIVIDMGRKIVIDMGLVVRPMGRQRCLFLFGPDLPERKQ
jgi:hypothetical protein